MKSWVTNLIQLVNNVWAAVLVTAAAGGTATWIYFTSTNATANSPAGNTPVSVQAGQGGNLGFGSSGGAIQHDDPPPAVPEANAGLVLIPLVAAVLLYSSRRLWRVRPSVGAGAQRATSEAEI